MMVCLCAFPSGQNISKLIASSSFITDPLARLRSTSASCAGDVSSGLAVRKRFWRFINIKAWYSQALRMMAFWLYQYIWGYEGPTGLAPARGSPSRQQGISDDGQQGAAATSLSGFDGLEDVYMELLSLRRKGKTCNYSASFWMMLIAGHVMVWFPRPPRDIQESCHCVKLFWMRRTGEVGSSHQRHLWLHLL